MVVAGRGGGVMVVVVVAGRGGVAYKHLPIMLFLLNLSYPIIFFYAQNLNLLLQYYILTFTQRKNG